jgi:hypothetical protein
MIKTVHAALLNGEWIGCEVMFHWQFPGSGVHSDVWGYVRALHHDADTVTVWLSTKEGEDRTGFGLPLDTFVRVYTKTPPIEVESTLSDQIESGEKP